MKTGVYGVFVVGSIGTPQVWCDWCNSQHSQVGSVLMEGKWDEPIKLVGKPCVDHAIQGGWSIIDEKASKIT